MTMEFTPEFRNEYIITIGKGADAKDYITHRGLIHLITEQNNVQSIHNEIAQLPNPTNDYLAVVVSTVKMKDGRIFTGIGDCDNKNANPKITPHKMRMAETRAEGRALRKVLGITMLMVEEMTSLVETEEPITTPQVNFISKLMKEKNIDKEVGRKMLFDITNKSSLSEASKREASIFIEALQALDGPGSKNPPTGEPF